MSFRIGVLTSGGDAPGMNAAVRAVCRASLEKGMEVIGIKHGYSGLLEGEYIKMDAKSVSDIIHKGGTCLYTARCEEFKTAEGQEKGRKKAEELGLDGLVVIGGDGSFRGAAALSSLGVPCVGIPGTIDNDISCTDYTIGFDTAMNTAVEMIDRLRDTAEAHDRCSVVEVMGRSAGYLALNVAVASAAEAVIVPERNYDIKAIAEKMKETMALGKKYFIVVVAEGVGKTEEIARQLHELSGAEMRLTVLGHIQRGGSPTLKDRVVATEMGFHAVELLEQGIGNRIVGMKDGKIYDVDIIEALSMKKPFPDKLYDILYKTAF